MPAENAFTFDTFLKKYELLALETTFKIENENCRQVFSQAPWHVMKKSLGEIKVCVYGCDQFVDVSEFDCSDCFQLIIVQQGEGRLWTRKASLYLGSGDVCLVNPSENIKATVKSGSCVITISMPVKTLEADAVHLGYNLGLSGLVFKLDLFKLEHLGVLKHQILSLLDAEPSQTSEELTIQYRRFFSCLLLEQFENNCNEFFKITSCQSPKIDKIRCWVISEPRKEYKSSDIAAYLNVSKRSLYYLFENELGMSPRTYICQIKLECVHKELKDITNKKNITRVALEYGFNNLGRFSKIYRDYFGELPSETCRK